MENPKSIESPSILVMGNLEILTFLKNLSKPSYHALFMAKILR